MSSAEPNGFEPLGNPGCLLLTHSHTLAFTRQKGGEKRRCIRMKRNASNKEC